MFDFDFIAWCFAVNPNLSQVVISPIMDNPYGHWQVFLSCMSAQT